jgi:hypothetical protein
MNDMQLPQFRLYALEQADRSFSTIQSDAATHQNYYGRGDTPRFIARFAKRPTRIISPAPKQDRPHTVTQQAQKPEQSI